MRISLAALILTFNSISHGAVWEAHNSWTAEAETHYSQWVATNFKADIFSNPSSPWYGIATDCADAIYAARIIFAYENSLPVTFTDIETQRPILTQETTQWDELQTPQKLRRFIKWVSHSTNTSTLGYDTLPVKIHRDFFRAGIVFVNPSLSVEDENILGTRGGHAEMVINIEDNGFIRTLYSTTPIEVRKLITTRNPYSWPVNRWGGFRLWKTSAATGVSNEQFEIAGWSPQTSPTRKQIYQWHESIRRSLRFRPPTIEERSDVVIESICNLWQGRVLAVDKAWKAIQSNGGRCLSASLMEEHATTKRDARIREAYGQLNDLMYWQKNQYPTPGLEGSVKDAKNRLQECSVMTGISLTNSWQLFLKLIDGHLTSQASWSPGVRWGERSSRGGERCQ